MIGIEFGLQKFFSQKDESNLFDWLHGIEGVKSIKGVGRILEIELSDDITKSSILEIIAAMSRYGLDLSCMARLSKDYENFSWIDDPRMYWYDHLK